MINNSVVDLETTRDHKCVDEKVDKKMVSYVLSWIS